MPQSRYLAGLDAEKRAKLEQKLLARQSGRCFICDEPIDLMLHKGQLDIDQAFRSYAERLGVRSWKKKTTRRDDKTTKL